MTPLETFRRISQDPLAALTEWTEDRGLPAVGTNCSCVPEEIIWASGALPFRLLGLSLKTTLADRHLPAFCCSPVKTILEDGLSGSLRDLSGTAFAAGCDSMQRLSDIWRLNVPQGFHLDLELPAKLSKPASLDYLQAVLRRFHQDLLGSLGLKEDGSALPRAIELFNELRARLQELARLRRDRPGCLSGADFLAVSLAAQVMDRAQGITRLDELLAGLKGPPADEGNSLPRLALAGSPCLLPRMISLIEECPARVVADDLCTGERFFHGHVEETADPYEALARRLAARPPCPAKHAGLEARTGFLLQQIKDSQAQGVVLAALKFCDPQGFDIPHIQEVLAAEGLPCLTLELEEQRFAEEQLRTRCQAFVERLEP